MTPLGMGFYRDGDTLHFMAPEFLDEAGWPDTPANRDWACRMAQDAARQVCPNAEYVMIEDVGGPVPSRS